jgi:vancomycin resistance protein YoaR
MSKHSIYKHLKKKYHPKKLVFDIIETIKKQKLSINRVQEPKPTFLIFGLNKSKLLKILIPTLLLICVIIFFEIRYHNKFLPNILVGGENVSGQTYVEALNHFKEKAKGLERNGLNINFEGSKGKKKINIPMTTAGLTADNSIEYFTLDDYESDLKEAYNWGHNKNIFYLLKEQLRLLFGKKKFNFSTSIQKEAVSSLLDGEINGFFTKSLLASFLLTENKMTISNEQIGESVDKDEVINILEKKLTNLNESPTVFKTHTEIPSVTKADLEPFLNFAENFTKENTLIFQYKKHNWKIKESKLASWLTITKESKLGIDQIKLENYLENNISKSIDSPPQNSRFTIQKGKLVEIVSGKSGNIIDIDDLIEKIEKEISLAGVSTNSENKIIPLQIETIKVEPKVTKQTIEKYLIKDLVGKIRTNFKGSTANREHNIKIGVATIDGILIAPGAEFSTIASIGPVTGKEGYLKEMVIKENKTTKEFGGGLCQVATTLFRLALNAGMPISERINHRFVVHYYDPPGLDATIYGPHPDFRFVNDTNGYLLLQARVENQQVIMELYGQKDGRTVEISKPVYSNRIPAPPTKYVSSFELPIGQTKCTEIPHEGLTTNVLYTVTYPDGIIKKRNFLSIYQPWQKVCLVGKALY